MDFHSLQWSQLKHDHEVIAELRRDVRVHRRETGRAGHRFNPATLKNVWAADDVHLVLNHTDDPAWQHWHHGAQGWYLVHWHPSRREAQAAAELPLRTVPVDVVDMVVGLRVEAGWPGRGSTMIVTCSSPATAEDVAKVYSNIGCTAVIHN